MIASTTSKGRLAAGDGDAAEAAGETLPEHVLRILARVRYQTRLTSRSVAVATTWVNGVIKAAGVGT